MKPIYGATPLKRRRRTAAELEQLDAQIIDVLRADHPQSIRHIFYRMTDPRLPQSVDKTDLGYERICARLKILRRTGTVPYSWIADMSRQGYLTPTFKGGADFLRRVKDWYRADPWEKAKARCEVWVESRSLASVLRADCEEFAVSLYPCGGFSSISFANTAAEELNADAEDSRPLHVLYVGDYDPAGVMIDVSLERELRLHLRPDIELRFERLGINPDQIEKYQLPEKPRKASERRARHITHTVEAEAMPARILRGIVRKRIERLLPRGAMEAARKEEQAEREWLERVAADREEEGE